MTSVALSAGEYAAEISLFGGGPRSLTYKDQPLLVSYEEEDFPPLSSGIILAPWPNRTAEGVFSHEGQLHRLEITEPGRATAIHGFVGAQHWEFVEASSTHVVLETPCGPRAGWPWTLVVRALWSLDEHRGLSGHLTVRNSSDNSCPLGVGWHPYLSACGAPLDECTLTLPVSTNLPLDPVRNLPAGPEIDATKVLPADPREGVSMGGLWLDHCFGGVLFDEVAVGGKTGEAATDNEAPGGGKTGDAATGDGRGPAGVVDRRSTVSLVNPEGTGSRLWADEHFGWYQVFTADPARREGYPGVGRALAVEPMTVPPNALRSGVDVRVLEPGEAAEYRFGVSAITA